jgi:hypothetical protein
LRENGIETKKSRKKSPTMGIFQFFMNTNKKDKIVKRGKKGKFLHFLIVKNKKSGGSMLLFLVLASSVLS